jgi:hypothetical protein
MRQRLSGMTRASLAGGDPSAATGRAVGWQLMTAAMLLVLGLSTTACTTGIGSARPGDRLYSPGFVPGVTPRFGPPGGPG